MHLGMRHMFDRVIRYRLENRIKADTPHRPGVTVKDTSGTKCVVSMYDEGDYRRLAMFHLA